MASKFPRDRLTGGLRRDPDSGAILVNLDDSVSADLEATDNDVATRGVLRDSDGAVLVKVTGLPSSVVSEDDARLLPDPIDGASAQVDRSFLRYQENTGKFVFREPDFVSPKDWGAVGDGASRPLSTRFGTLAAAQAVYPKATSLTDELDWAAFQTALDFSQARGNGHLLVPATTSVAGYRFNRTLTYANDKPLIMFGLGAASRITWATDLGYGKYAIGCPDDGPSNAGYRHEFWHFNISGPGTFPLGGNSGVYGYPPALMFGLELKRSCVAENINAVFFYAGIVVRGDHERIIRCTSNANFYNLYYGAPVDAGSSGDQFIQSTNLDGGYWASVAVSQNAAMDGATMQSVHTGNTPHCFYKEAPQGLQIGVFVNNSTLLDVSFESFGHSAFFDESTQHTGTAIVKGTTTVCGGTMIEPSGATNTALQIGGAQTLTISGATGGTFTVTYKGVTSAAIAWNASNITVQNTIAALSSVGGGTNIEVKANGAGKQIELRKTASLYAPDLLTVDGSGLTGTSPSATMGPLTIPIGSGPRVRPTATTVLTCGATGGTFKIGIDTGDGTGVQTTTALAWNATAAAVRLAIAKLPNVGADNVIVTPSTASAVAAGGPWTLSFVGALLGANVTVTTDGALLTGGTAATAVAPGTTFELKPRLLDYLIDVLAMGWKIRGGHGFPGFAQRLGVVRVRYSTDGVGSWEGGSVDAVVNNASISAGALSFFAASRMAALSEFIGAKTGRYRLMYVTGACAKGDLLASSGDRSDALVYPASTDAGALARPHAGFAMAAQTATGTQLVAQSSAGSSAIQGNYDAAGIPAAYKHLKPSATTAGAVTPATAASDKIVAGTLAVGASGKVELSPIGCI